jgi:hypothetical protein
MSSIEIRLLNHTPCDIRTQDNFVELMVIVPEHKRGVAKEGKKRATGDMLPIY